MKTVFLRVLEAEDKATALLEAVANRNGRQHFGVDVASFAAVPRSPFAYWVSDGVRSLFESRDAFGADGRISRQGLATANDFRWVRLWWERDVRANDEAFPVPYAKGGAFSPFYADLALTIRWGRDGRSIKEWKAEQFRLGVFTANNSKCWNENLYFRPGLTWPLRSQRGLSVRSLPSGVIFGQKGSAAFVPDDAADQLLSYLAVFNSIPCLALVQMQMAFGAYDVGVVARTPVPALGNSELRNLAALTRRIWSLKRSLDTRTETSHAFTLPALLQVAGADVAARAAAWSEHVRTVEAELVAIQAEIDERCFDLYGIDEADRRTITDGFGTRGSEDASSDGANDAEDDTGEDTNENESTVDATGLAAELVSWALGVAFGRFDVRLATGARPIREEPEPFAPLPACSLGMLTGEDGLPLSRPPAGYPLAFPQVGVLVDDLGHAQDLPTAVRAVFDAVFGAGADRWWHDVAALLDPKGHDLRVWLAGSFFEHHLKRHSKSRRKAPILWQLGTPSGRYSVWLYAHRLTRDNFFQLQNEVVGPKLTHEERQLTSLKQNAGGSPSASQRKEIAAQEALVEELRAMLDEVKRVAPLWNPNLDDGVVLTMAPLWRLVPQYKPWQKELKSKWDELAAGKYDWAHLAMHLWPERVVPKCAADRSLAIAHGLEEVFWTEGSDGKWKPRATPLGRMDEVVQDRASPAVKAALKSLIEAPATRTTGTRAGRNNGSRATRRRREHTLAGTG